MGTPIASTMSSRCASGWSERAELVERSPRSTMSEGCRAPAASPNAAEPMSGGIRRSVATASWPGGTSNRRQSSATSTRSPNCRIIATVSWR